MEMMLPGLLAMVLMGVTLGVFGAGGSILTVPILVFLLGVSATEATAYSLFIVGITALFTCWPYHQKGLIRFKIGLVFAIPAFSGVYSVRLLLIPQLPDPVLSWGAWVVGKDTLILMVFAVIMMLAAYAMIRPSKQAEDESKEKARLNFPLIALEGLIVGGVTGFVGAGGGFLIIPALVLLAGLPMREAVATSLMIIAIKSLFGFVGDIQSGMAIDGGLLLGLSALAIVGALVGTWLSRYIDGDKLKPAFGYFVLLMGVAMFARELLAG